MPNKLVIISDLDGTLLDHQTYSFSAALPALELIKSKGVPLIICTSKTRGEIETYRKLLDNNFPFISENGGGIFIPNGFLKHEFKYDKSTNGYRVIELGTRRELLIEVLKCTAKDAEIQIKGFSDMKISEIAELTGLDEKDAKLASERDYSEPFLIYGNGDNANSIKHNIHLKAYRHTQGGRFHHILGNNDKGKAVKTLCKLFVNEYGEHIKTIGLGDSLNDLSMLEVVDVPILVQKPNGEYDDRIKLKNLIPADGKGPQGWNSAILKLLAKH